MLCLQRDPYVPTTYEQDKLAQLTDLIDVFTRKVRPVKAGCAQDVSQCLTILFLDRLLLRHNKLRHYMLRSGSARIR